MAGILVGAALEADGEDREKWYVAHDFSQGLCYARGVFRKESDATRSTNVFQIWEQSRCVHRVLDHHDAIEYAPIEDVEKLGRGTAECVLTV